MSEIQYMHTIDGQPGYFDGRQIVFAASKSIVKLCPDLKSIRSQQKLCRQWRKTQGFIDWAEYGHRRVRVLTPA